MAGGFPGGWFRSRHGSEGEIVESCATVTTLANELRAQIHDRMPVISTTNDHEVWLAQYSIGYARLYMRSEGGVA